MTAIATTSAVRRTNEVVLVRRELTQALVEAIRPDGSIDGPGGSRMVESALLARLLAHAGGHARAGARLERFVRNTSPTDEFERVVQQSFLHPDHAQNIASRFLADFHHSTGMRKRIVLATVLALVGDGGCQPPFPHLSMRYQGHAVWTEVALCAAIVLHAAERGERSTQHERFLVQALQDGHAGEVWHGNVLVHLIALHAVRTFDPGSQILRQGMKTLTRVINPDGGVPFLAAQDIWVSALAGHVLSEVPQACDAASRIGRFIAARQLPDGGWGFCRRTDQSDVDDTSRCVVLLNTLDPQGYGDAIARGRAHLLRNECQGGGFPTYRREDPAEPDLTAGAMIALTPDSTAAAAVTRAGDFLLTTQNPDGTFEPSWTLSESSVLCHVAQALCAVRRCRPDAVAAAITKIANRLTETQNADSGWGHHPGEGSDVISTSHAIRLLAHREPARAAAAVGFLLSSRGPDSRFTSVPDQVGPRPLPYVYPVLTDIHILGALNAVWSVSGRRKAG